MGYSSRSSVLKQIHKEFNHKAENDKCHKRSKNKILINLISDAYQQVLTYYRHCAEHFIFKLYFTDEENNLGYLTYSKLLR